MSALNLHL